MKNTGKFIVLVALILCIAGCSKRESDSSHSGGDTPQEGVVVTLGMEVSAMQNAGNKSPNAHAQSSRVVASERTSAMLVELIESSEKEQTPASKSAFLPDEATIHNLWVFVYDHSATNSPQVNQKYYSELPTDGVIKQILSPDQRVVFIANTFDPDLGASEDIQLGSTYQNLLDKTMTVTSSLEVLTDDGKSLILYGTTVYQGSSAQLDIKMLCNAVKVNFEVKLGEGDKELSPGLFWTIQVCDLPDKSLYLPPTDGDASMPFPETVVPVSYPKDTIAPTAPNPARNTWYVPVNRRGTKPGTTPFDRKTNAPNGATYVKIIGRTNFQVYTYTIHLGENFAEDYNLRPNYQYTYRVTLHDTEGVTSDSRVDFKKVGTYVGRVGGPITGDITKGWGFSKLLYVDDVVAVDDPQLAWGRSGKRAQNRTNGKANTWLLKSAIYPGGNYCFTKNVNSDAITGVTDENFAWYLPAQEQLMGIWAMNKANTEFPLNGMYLTSTELEEDYPIYVNLTTGRMPMPSSSSQYKKSYPMSVRCVSETEAPLDFKPQVYKDIDGSAILDCSAATGTPAGAVTTTPKGVGGDAYQTKYRNGSNNNPNPYAWENDQVYEKLEIAPMEINTNGKLTATGTFQMYWNDAFNKCKALNYKGITGWRLPTQRELILMYLFREQFNEIFTSADVNGTAFHTGYQFEYHSLSEFAPSTVSYMRFSSGMVLIEEFTGATYTKNIKNIARCVREL